MIPDAAEIAIHQRRPIRQRDHIFLIGPGGVGKSTLGTLLAQGSGRVAIDLDLEFCDRIGEIGAFIAAHGYPHYRAINLALAIQLVEAQAEPIIFITSSGFLAAPNETADHQQALRLVSRGCSICLLPSLDRDRATEIVVSRQLLRGFGFERASETEKFRQRFSLYRPLGDLLVLSTAPPQAIAERVALHLGLRT